MAERKIILVVDDMSENLTLMRSMLEDYFDVRLAKSGRMALSLLEKIKVDLILLDIEMPSMSGFELIRRIKLYETDNKKTPIIFVTTHGDKDYIQEAVSAGAKDYLLKPVNAEALYKKIDAVIGMPSITANSLEGILQSLTFSINSGDSARAESLLAELGNAVKSKNEHFIQYAEDIKKFILAFDYEKALQKIDSFLYDLSHEKKK